MNTSGCGGGTRGVENRPIWGHTGGGEGEECRDGLGVCRIVRIAVFGKKRFLFHLRDLMFGPAPNIWWFG